GLSAVNAEKNKEKREKKKKEKRKPLQDTNSHKISEEKNDLRLRHPEDDEGKGAKLDVKL
ncbi:hypothetical protein ACFLQJ_00995, partial [Calditrichota bacterium]